MKNPDELAKIITASETLTELPRTGYVLAGVEHPEAVSSHCFQTAFLVMLISPWENGIGVDRAIRIALVHDISESLVTDLPLVAKKFLNKDEAEIKAASELLEDHPDLLELYLEYREGQTLEAKFVRDMDRLQMLIRASRYKRTSRGDMSNFLDHPTNFHFELSQKVLTAFQKLDGKTSIR